MGTACNISSIKSFIDGYSLFSTVPQTCLWKYKEHFLHASYIHKTAFWIVVRVLKTYPLIHRLFQFTSIFSSMGEKDSTHPYLDCRYRPPLCMAFWRQGTYSLSTYLIPWYHFLWVFWSHFSFIPIPYVLPHFFWHYGHDILSFRFLFLWYS